MVLMCRACRTLRDHMADLLRADDGKGSGNLKIHQRPKPGQHLMN
jgi:hypothetical protein